MNSLSVSRLVVQKNSAPALQVQPLERLTLLGADAGSDAEIVVRDGAGRAYFRTAAKPEIEFQATGAIGNHNVQMLDASGSVVGETSFQLDAQTRLDDGGRYRELFDLLYRTMCVYDPDGARAITWKGQTYHYFVPWMLDQVHTARGMQYFHPSAGEMADLFRDNQRADGMIYSFIQSGSGKDYYQTAYGPYGYFGPTDGKYFFGRQPNENHVEYLYVNQVYMAWKATGDNDWMQGHLDSSIRALNYGMNDPARWSKKFGLLKRSYTIDTWDFQIHDQYTPEIGLNPTMLIDPDKTKFGIFYGDNTGYAQACDELAQMLSTAGREEKSQEFTQRARDIRQRLDEVAWNGNFYTHRIEEDPAVKRDLGVDESTQISLSNAYAVNRNLTHEQAVAILQTYRNLQQNLPPGSPGEWYAIYPPFERGWGSHGHKWQYMNGGIATHAAGELARGAFEHGYENYGVDILNRLLDLGKAHGDVLAFAYTGAFPTPPTPQWKTVDLSGVANMDLLDSGDKESNVPGWMSGEAGNDMRNLPTGQQTFADVPFSVINPADNARRSVVAVSQRFAKQVEIPIGQNAHTIYLLHTADSTGPSNVAASLTFAYDDGTSVTRYILKDKHLTGWWFPELKGKNAGVAWSGPNEVSTRVGVCWAAIENPHPEKTVASLKWTAAEEGGTYALIGLTLSDLEHYVEPSPVSFGGPDNWTGGTAMGGLIEGLVGVYDEATRYQKVRLSPRWSATDASDVEVVVRYAVSEGYVAYRYQHQVDARQLQLQITGSGDEVELRILLPEGVTQVQSVSVNDASTQFTMENIENSHYVVLPLSLEVVQNVVINY